jgi:small subunit ribosomal protein S4e
MHQTRSEVIKALPLARKGTKYVARASRNSSNSVPLLIAVRDMLNLANTSKEVKGMIHNKKLKINGKLAKSLTDPICLFSRIEADKNYLLIMLPTGRFSFVETKEHDRKLKIIGKTMVGGKRLQYALHDGTNILSEKDFSVGDTLILTNDNKISKHISLDKGKEVFAFSGSYTGKNGKIQDVSGNKITVKFDKEEAVIDKSHVIVI